MKVRDVMTTPVITVRAQATCAEVIEVLLANGISGVPVVDGEGRLLGVVTEADLISREAYGPQRRRPLALVADYLRGRDPQWVRKAGGRTAAEVMNAAPQWTPPDAEVADAARWLLEDHHKRLPVVEDGHLVGILTRRDLLAAMTTESAR
jgi:CBS domain-containing protein